MIAVARTFSLVGVEAEPVYVEADVGRGLPAFAIVGLPDTSVRESRERVRSALLNSGFSFPMQRITANLAPAHLKKAGPGFDLAIAAALLASSGQIDVHVLDRYALAGELALDGTIRPVPGALAMAEAARSLGLQGIAVASQDAGQARLVDGLEVIAIEHVSRLTDLAAGSLASVPREATSDLCVASQDDAPDLEDLRGQPTLRRALEVLRIAGACRGTGDGVLPVGRPFRAPHHSASARALIGGGSPPRPGEVTRAHRGVLFLDELGEFRRDALEALRQPLERGSVTLARAGGVVSMPCSFMLVAASNPCPCGHGRDS